MLGKPKRREWHVRFFFLTWEVFEQLLVGRIFPNEKEKPLDGLDRLVACETAADDTDFMEVLFRDKKFFSAGAGLENIDRWVDALVADFAIQDDLHIASAFELLEN
jgi:hypothetical protein